MDSLGKLYNNESELKKINETQTAIQKDIDKRLALIDQGIDVEKSKQELEGLYKDLKKCEDRRLGIKPKVNEEIKKDLIKDDFKGFSEN